MLEGLKSHNDHTIQFRSVCIVVLGINSRLKELNQGNWEAGPSIQNQFQPKQERCLKYKVDLWTGLGAQFLSTNFVRNTLYTRDISSPFQEN